MKSANRKDALIIASLATVGIVLGATTAPLFAPVPKSPVTEPISLSGRAQVSAPGETEVWADPGRDEWVSFSGQYAPADDYNGPIWQYPAPVYEAWEPEPSFSPDELDLAAIASAVDAADEAEEAAKDLSAPQQSAEVRKSDLANGLY